MAAVPLSQTPLFVDAALEAYWACDGNFNDSGPNGYNLTPSGSPTFQAGAFGDEALFVAASSQYASIARASCADIRISGSQTWGMWIKQTTITSYQAPMRMSNDDGSSARGFLTSADSGNIVYFDMPGLTTNTQVNTGAVGLSTGTRALVVAVYNSATTTLKIYVNGAEAGSVTASGSATDITSGAFALGTRGGSPAQYADAAMDDNFIFSRALTAQEISDYYNGNYDLSFQPAWNKQPASIQMQRFHRKRYLIGIS